jgi:hypothetical protein
MERALSSYKPGIPKKWLLLISGILWLVASWFLFKKGTYYLFDYSHHILFNIVIGFICGILFFFIVFHRIANKYIQRIVKLDSEKPCLFSFTGIKGYIMIVVMISAGLLLRKIQIIDTMSLHVFFICMGTALFFASLKFFYSLLTYRKLVVSGASSVK